jgi:hypothetical protein
LPVLGEQVFITAQQRIEAREEFVRRLKRLPEAEKQATMAALPEALQVPPPEDPQVFMDWEQVRELVAYGIACQPHTATHPILTRISPEEVRNELRTARDKIVAETAQSVEAFAFPNGTPDDYDATSLQILHELGFQAAFTLSSGPVRNRLVQQYPLQIPRVFLGYKDTFGLFVAKVMGVPALMDRPAYLPLPAASNDV